MLPLILALLIATQSPAQPAPQDDIKEALARAEALYYEARFNESIKLLNTVNEILKTRPDRIKDRITAKLQLALSNIGINDNATAKLLLGEIYMMDPEYVLDPLQFSPKVIALANDAKNEQRQLRCRKAGEDARNHLANLNGPAVLGILDTMKAKCPELAQFELQAADVLHKQGLTEYKQGNYLAALQSFRSAIKLAPSHELAAQYLDLTSNKLQVAGDLLLLQWQKNFDAGLYKEAAADYRTIRTYGESGSPTALNHATSEYRKALTPLVEGWNQGCSAGDMDRVTHIQHEISELLPDPSFAADLRSKMGTCTRPEPPKVAAVPEARPTPAMTNVMRTAPIGCLHMDPQAAVARLKTRVSPVIPREALAFLQNAQVIVRVKVKIDENGNVTPGEATGSNPLLNNSVRSAVEQWKFSPAKDESGTRCVETELSVAVGR
jgi:tetratricopeptide (TPR) repeat protein